MTRRLSGWLVGLGVVALLLALAARACGYALCWNGSPSLPRGLYRLNRGAAVDRGSTVLLCPPLAGARRARERRYLPEGSCPGGAGFLGKLVIATVGDVVALGPAGLTVDGISVPVSAPLPADSRGRPLAHAQYGLYRVRRGEVWVYAPHVRSLDSRYFGPIALRSVQGVLDPLLVTAPALGGER
jgi:conjugative transfer signal peptidase TraF